MIFRATPDGILLDLSYLATLMLIINGDDYRPAIRSSVEQLHFLDTIIIICRKRLVHDILMNALPPIHNGFVFIFQEKGVISILFQTLQYMG